jgi:signal peptidase I
MDSEKTKSKSEKNKNDWSLIEFIKFAVITLIVVIPIRMYVAQPFVVNGASMSPTFETGQYIVVDQLTYHLTDPSRGDVIVFRFPQDTSKFFIKRVIGLPGETIAISEKEVTITDGDGIKTVLDEPYLEFVKDSFMETELANDEYFVMGDNRSASLDSRIWGPLGEEYIIGRAFVRLLPANKINFLPGEFDFSKEFNFNN